MNENIVNEIIDHIIESVWQCGHVNTNSVKTWIKHNFNFSVKQTSEYYSRAIVEVCSQEDED